jgi:hypothetical protein
MFHLPLRRRGRKAFEHLLFHEHRAPLLLFAEDADKRRTAADKRRHHYPQQSQGRAWCGKRDRDRVERLHLRQRHRADTLGVGAPVRSMA